MNELIVPGMGDSLKQRTLLVVHKFHAPDLRPDDNLTLDELMDHCGSPFEVLEKAGNLLMYGGASAQWETLIGNAFTNFGNTNANIGVGDSNTAEAATQTDLQAASNKFRQATSSVTHTDGTAVGNASAVWVATFATGNANFAWQEWAIFNANTSGRMLNRKVVSLGTKTSAQSWVATATLTLA